MSHIGFNINDFFIKYDEYEKDIINKFKNINNMIIKFYWGYPNARYELEELLNNIETDKKYLILFINDYNDSYVNIPNNVFLYRTGLYHSLKKCNEYIMPIYLNNNIIYSLINGLQPISKTDKPKICFRGSINTYHERNIWLDSLSNSNLLECNFIKLIHFRGGTVNDLIENLKTSEFCFCPRGTGNFSIRFYETLYYGRIPVLLNTDIKLPFDNKIYWNEICVISNSIEEMPQDIYNFWQSNDIVDVQIKCKEIYNLYFYGENIANSIYEEIKDYL